MFKYVLLNGDFIEYEKAVVPISDLAIQRGYGIFDFFRIEEGKFIFSEYYLDRFYKSMKRSGFDFPYYREDVHNMVISLVQKNEAPNSYIKLIVTGGNSPNGFLPNEKPNFMIINHKINLWDNKLFSEGANLISDEYMRPFPTVKSINYFNAVKLSPKMKKYDAVDVLYHFNNKVHETSRANVFMVKNKKIYTPKKEILEGITRKRFIKAAKSEFNLSYKSFSLKKLLKADEVFITSTTKDVMPIVKIDKHVIGNGKTGKVCKKLIKLFNRKEFQI